MRVLMIGDIVGRPGRRVTAALLPRLRAEFAPDLVLANGENAAGGMGITAEAGHQLLEIGIDVLTLGNHTFRQKEVSQFLEECPVVIRPANYPPGAPGRGATVVSAGPSTSVAIVNLMGRTFMDPLDCPFRAADRTLKELEGKASCVIVDMHAEATSEKIAMGYYLDGRVAAVLGTHTHVATADERILGGGTAYITDCGMTGPVDSVLGIKPDLILRRFVTGLPTRFQIAGGPAALSGVIVDVDEDTGRATRIERIARSVTQVVD